MNDRAVRSEQIVGGLEIERKFLLDRTPAIPDGAEVWRIEQGYLAQSIVDSEGDDGFSRGRLRRTIMPDGSIICTHTRKRGTGLVRSEIERIIEPGEFERYWPRTAGRRLRKLRHRVRDRHLIWEIDVFDQPELVLMEVELPSPDAQITLPEWLKPHVVREVTDDPDFTNASIAKQLGGLGLDL